EFADERENRHITAFHFLKLAFQERQFVIRPPIYQIRDFCSRFRMRSATTGFHGLSRSVCVACRATATTSFEHLDQRLDRLLNSKMLLDTLPSGVPKAQSQLGIAQQLFKCLSKRSRIAWRG